MPALASGCEYLLVCTLLLLCGHTELSCWRIHHMVHWHKLAQWQSGLKL